MTHTGLFTMYIFNKLYTNNTKYLNKNPQIKFY